MHGNASSSGIWKPILEMIGDSQYALAPDLRMYGNSAPGDRIDPRRGVSDWAEDMDAFVQTVIPKWENGITVVGHSLGALVAYRMLVNQRIPIRAMCLYAPPPPGGFDSRGPDPSFVDALVCKDREVVGKVVNALFWHPAFEHPKLEEIIDDVLKMQIGDGAYPMAMIEAVSPDANAGLEASLLKLTPKAPITWVYGKDDLLIGNRTMGAPEAQMEDQTRNFLNAYTQQGGSFEEVVYEHCGHSPYLEKEEERLRLMHWLASIG
jgi:pimeloyl-ACP methyl ester carboxylesterase